MEQRTPVVTAAELKVERVRQSKKIARQIWMLTTFILLFMILMAHLFGKSSKARDLERRLTWGMQFELRDKFKQAPVVDPRLRLIMFDDSSVQSMKRSGLNLREWAALLSYLDKHRPASIYIDKIFGLLDDEPNVLQDALPLFRGVRTPVSIGSFTSNQQIPGRDELSLLNGQFSARNYLSDALGELGHSTVSDVVKSSGLKDRSKAYIYGPIVQLQEVFRIGHIDYPISNQVFPMYQVDADRVIPSLALSGRIDFKLEKSGLSSGGKIIPRTMDGGILVNWLSPRQAYGQAMSFASAFAAMKSGTLWNKIPEDAHILIMPLAFTGNVDFKESPYGQLPGGLVLASVLNSVLTKQWLSDFSGASQLMILLVVLSGMLQMLKGMRSWLILFAGMLLIFLSGMQQFIYASTDIPWLAGEVFFGGTGVLLLSVRSLWDARRERLLNKFEEDYERLEREEKRLQKEMRDAARVALALRPDNVPDWPEFEISAFHKSMSEASGDWYFFERSKSGRFAHFVLCDISGHGVQAALVVSACKAILSMLRISHQAIFEGEDFLTQYASQLNEVLYLNGQGNHTATLIGLTFDVESSKVSCLNCGHPFPIIYTTIGEKIQSLTTKSGDPIGFSAEAQFILQQRKILLGDCLIAHSDGVPVSRARRVLQKYFRESAHGPLIPAKRLIEAIFKQFKKEKLEVSEDDTSLVVIRKVR